MISIFHSGSVAEKPFCDDLNFIIITFLKDFPKLLFHVISFEKNKNHILHMRLT